MNISFDVFFVPWLHPLKSWSLRQTRGGSLWVHQIQLTIADLVGEAHDTHHPLGGDLYYEEQKPEAWQAQSEVVPSGTDTKIS